MVRQAFDLLRASPRSPLGPPLGREHLEGLDQAPVQPPPPLPQEAVVGHLVRQGMLEGVFGSGNRRVSYRNTAAWRCARPRCSTASDTSAIARSRAKGTSVPITAAVWSRAFASAG